MARYKNEGKALVHLPELTLGDRGYAVGWLQAMLTIRGYHIPVETVRFFDNATEKAVADYQRDMGLTATGTVTAGTWAFLLMLE